MPQKQENQTSLVNRSHLKAWKNSAERCLEQITAATVREAITSVSPAYGFINQDTPTTARAILSLQIIALVKTLNVGKTMDQYQVAKTADLILNDEIMRSLKPDDIKVCFEKIVKGHYGVNYDRIDTQTIFDTLNRYVEERQLTMEDISLKRHELQRDGKMAEANPEGQKKIAEIFRAVLKEVKPEIKYKSEKVSLTDGKYFIEVVPEGEVKEYPIKTNKIIQKSERDVFIQNAFREFQEILKAKGSLIKTGDFIEFNGQPVNEIEYVQQRTTEYDLDQLNYTLPD